MKKIITISRQFGAGGGEIGQKVAAALNYEFFDKSIILEAAEEENIDLKNVILHDEKIPALAGFTQTLFNFYETPLNEKIFEAQKKVIRKFGEHGKCVIVGRNANSILREFDDSLHIFVYADEQWRVQRLKKEKMQNMSEEKILQHMIKIDKTREKYCSYYSKMDFGSLKGYDLSFNTSKISIDECVKIIVDIAKND